MSSNLIFPATIANESNLDKITIEVNGVAIVVSGVASDTENNTIKYPEAPDGTVTYDSATGAVVQHADSATAFAAETATNKVVIDRQDYCFLETWHEVVTDKDAIFPLGNVQCGATAWEGIPLSSVTELGIGQGYSAFGEWDTSTEGKGAKWSTLTDTQKKTFLSDPENNIYLSQEGELVQVRYRIRTIAGAGNGDWANPTPDRTSAGGVGGGVIQYDSKAVVAYTAAMEDARDFEVSIYQGFFQWKNQDGTQNDAGIGKVLTAGRPDVIDDKCYLLPICMVSRLNQGAYSKEYNERGAATKGGKYLTGYRPTSRADCFSGQSGGDIASGASNSGRPDDQYYDAIYAAYVQDLRVSSLVRPLDEVREEYKRKSIAGEVRGWEKVPFTVVTQYTVDTSIGFSDSFTFVNGSALDAIGLPANVPYGNRSDPTEVNAWVIGESGAIYQCSYLGSNEVYLAKRHGDVTADFTLNSSYWIVSSLELLEQRAAKHTWTDIIGSPSAIKTAWPNGVAGQWLPIIPAGTNNQHTPLNRKSLDSNLDVVYSLNGGDHWYTLTESIDATTNTANRNWDQNVVALCNYTTLAHFTEDAGNATAVVVGSVFANVWYFDYVGCLLTSSLINKVNTGASGNRRQFLPLTSLGIDVSRLGYSEIKNEPAHGYTEHLPINLTHTNDTPAVKTLDYLTAESGKFNLQYAYKEMIYDGAWGDDNQFQITGGQSTRIDTNENTVLYGMAKLQDHCVQYFYSEDN